MVNIYADLVQKGLYTTDPAKAVDGVKIVHSSLIDQVIVELARREALKGA